LRCLCNEDAPNHAAVSPVIRPTLLLHDFVGMRKFFDCACAEGETCDARTVSPRAWDIRRDRHRNAAEYHGHSAKSVSRDRRSECRQTHPLGGCRSVCRCIRHKRLPDDIICAERRTWQAALDQRSDVSDLQGLHVRLIRPETREHFYQCHNRRQDLRQSVHRYGRGRHNRTRRRDRKALSLVGLS